uniref:Uncharacterized protein n=1 Tax=Clandestinovirus TaxID=2831644 RepID=A0A8F8PKB8_9VIRU|nr:hypothetical protein KOM_12_580 [Clandestinovirus]
MQDTTMSLTRKRSEEPMDMATKKQKMESIGLDKAIPESVIISSILPKLIGGMGLLHVNRYMKNVAFPRVKTLRIRITQDNRLDVLKNIANDIEYNKHVTSVKVTLVGIFDACSWYPVFIKSFTSPTKLVINLEFLSAYNDKAMVEYCLALWKCVCTVEYPELHTLSIKVPSEYSMEFNRINYGTKMAIALRGPDNILRAPQLKKLDFPFPQYITLDSSTQVDQVGGFWTSYSNHPSVKTLTVRDFGAMPITINSHEISSMIKPSTPKILDHLIIKKIFRGDSTLNITNTSTPVIPKLTITLLLNIDLCLKRTGPVPIGGTFATNETNLVIDYHKKGLKGDLLLKWTTFVNLIISSSMYKSINSDTIYTYTTRTKQFVIQKQVQTTTYGPLDEPTIQALDRIRPDKCISTAEPNFWDETVLAYVTFGCFLAHRALDTILTLDLLGEYLSCDSITIEDSVDLQKFLLLVNTFLIDEMVERADECGLPGVKLTCKTLHLNIRDEQKRYITPLVKLFHPHALVVNGWPKDLASMGAQ